MTVVLLVAGATEVLVAVTVVVVDVGRGAAGVPGTSPTVIVEVLPAVTVAVVNCTWGTVIIVLMIEIVLEDGMRVPADEQGTVRVVW